MKNSLPHLTSPKIREEQKTSAFTLVELLVVISILAILATIAFLSFNSYSSKARDGVRITTLKSIHQWLAIQYQKAWSYPLPDDYIDVVWAFKDWYIWESVTRIINISWKTTDPKENTLYSYSLDQTWKKIQLTWFLEENNPVIFSKLDLNLLSPLPLGEGLGVRVFATDYSSKFTYTIWDRVWILLDPITKAPINETTTNQTINLTTDLNNYTVVFSNTTSNSWTITGSGISLLTSISIIQSSCVLWNSVVTSWQQITAYNSSSVAYNQACSSTQRTCDNWTLKWDTTFIYDTCSPIPALNCQTTTYSWYTIPPINHTQTNPSITKNITWWIADISATCTNWVLTYWQENINCSTNYVLDNWACMQDICTWSAPEFSIANWTQKYNIPWLHSTTPKDCSYICQAWYYYNNTNLCIPASIWNIVPTEWQITQTPCTANNTYQDSTWQTTCKTVQSWYYSTPIWTWPKTWETQCEANNYCVNWVKTSCAVNYSSSVGSTSLAGCTANTQVVTCWTIPANTIRNTATSITQTWNWTTWLPATTTSYNTTVSTADCRYTCNTWFHTENAWVSCISNTQSCTITNWVWSQTWWWSARWTCTVVSCNSWYTVSGNTCIVASYPGCNTTDITVWTQKWAACNIWTTISWLTSSSYGGYYQFWRNDTGFTLSRTTDSWWAWWQWPCASWYHVPTQTEWQTAVITITGKSSWWLTTDQTLIKNTLKIPNAGRRLWDGTWQYQGTMEMNWTSSSANTTTWYYSMDGVSSTFWGLRANAMQIRCLKN
ncbi:MAG: hypothetical protein ACD_49C00055G0003 [uncultured bacterium (gcode 4)]|uniref:Uncharacterized protein n=1 Tax=uncultured bacterium (gcode 4) TaxID=1234023 RepID=K2AX31_9BACT|nr:MAG: hypothetical protein ACD_49C00055G0003 [uncultured bacterium (gcode 4)]